MITVITPFYNAEKTLKRCIDSVLSQSYKDFEYILVDDASTDKSLEVAYGFKDKRIRLITLIDQAQKIINHPTVRRNLKYYKGK